MSKKRAIIVKTKTGKTGNVYYKFLGELEHEKIQVHITGDDHNETGEKLLCESKSLTPVGFKD